MNDCYCEGQTEHGKVAVNSDDNFAIIEKNDSERDVLYRQERKAKRNCVTLRLRVENEEIRRRRIDTA
jgi:hypothetical protein